MPARSATRSSRPALVDGRAAGSATVASSDSDLVVRPRRSTSHQSGGLARDGAAVPSAEAAHGPRPRDAVGRRGPRVRSRPRACRRGAAPPWRRWRRRARARGRRRRRRGAGVRPVTTTGWPGGQRWLEAVGQHDRAALHRLGDRRLGEVQALALRRGPPSCARPPANVVATFGPPARTDPGHLARQRVVGAAERRSPRRPRRARPWCPAGARASSPGRPAGWSPSRSTVLAARARWHDGEARPVVRDRRARPSRRGPSRRAGADGPRSLAPSARDGADEPCVVEGRPRPRSGPARVSGITRQSGALAPNSAVRSRSA